MHALAELIARHCAVVAGVCLMAIVVVTTLNIVARKLMMPILGAHEATEYLAALLIGLTLAYNQLRKENISVLTLLYILTVAIVTAVRPELVGPPAPSSSFREKIRVVLASVGETIAVFVLIMGGLFLGFFTPTEAGAAGAAGLLLLALARRQLAWKGFVAAVGSSLSTTAMIMLIIAGATIYGHFLALTRLPVVASEWVMGLGWHPYAVMLVVAGIYLIGGCVMDSLALLLLTLPIFYPVSLQLGFDPIWFGVMIVIFMEMAVITPPVGINVYVIKGVAGDVPLGTIFKGIVPFLIAEIVLVFLLLFFPQMATFLPSLM
jgi:tripartite ATP-independent transporter DctM subunit